MKLSDVIAKYLLYKNVHTIFGYQGGSITHMIDSFDRMGIQYVQTYNEQGASLAADAYARTSELRLGVAIGTNGPGATNMVTGIANAYCDSIPVLFFTGQVHTFAMKNSEDVRQESFQEIDILSIVKPITKYAATIKRTEDAIPEIAKAIVLAKEGRPGPVLIDLPVDIQGLDFPIENIRDYFQKIDEMSYKYKERLPEIRECDLEAVKKEIFHAERPILLVGGGARVGNAIEEIRNFVEKTEIPVVVSLMGLDVLEHSDQHFVGFIGGYGNRYANIALQNADCILVLGSRLDGRQTGKRKDLFANNARLIHVDIDKAELGHYVNETIKINADLAQFVTCLSNIMDNCIAEKITLWRMQIDKWKKQFPGDNELDSENDLNPNVVIRMIGDCMPQNTIACCDVGQNQMWMAQSFRIKGLFARILNSGGLGTMGYSLPAAIGAYYASPDNRIIAFMGDGGFQMNIQELQVIGQMKLPIDIVVMNNHALGLIRDIHEKYYDCRYVGSVSGFSLPNLERLSEAYGLVYSKIVCLSDIKNVFKENSNNEPRLIEIEFNDNTYVRPELLGNDGLDHQKPYKEYQYG